MYTITKKREVSAKTVRYDLKYTDGEKVCALVISNHDPIIFDYKYKQSFCSKKWTFNSGYPSSKTFDKVERMDKIVLALNDQQGENILHINGNKNDNRLCNLTFGDLDFKNGVRRDKLPPCKELQDLGITELPKYVRWDGSELKFVIETHPTLKQEQAEGKRKRAIISGTKSVKFTIPEKYQDILTKLHELDVRYNPMFAKRHELMEQYDTICKIIKSDMTGENNQEVIATSRYTLSFNKDYGKVPEGCGVNQEDIPEYCHYKPATENRGDQFIIKNHPEHLRQNIKVWTTTSSIKTSTATKFEMMLKELENLKVSN